MATIKAVIPAKLRSKTTKGGLATLRREGFVPAVLYGLKSEPTLITLKATDLREALSMRNAVFNLDIEGKVEAAMLKQVERDAIRRDLIHIDFLRVNDTHPVVVSVPIATHGIPVGVKQQGGVFSVMKKSVRVKASIANIPEALDLDVSELTAGKIFYVRDLKIANVVFLTPAKTALFGVTSGRAEEEAVTAKPAAAAAPAAAAKPAAGAKAPAAAPAAKGGDKKK